MNFKRTGVVLKELGDYLKETREKNCVGIDEAADDLNLPKNVLENIEKGNSRAFRDMLELKDRVKEYAKYLGLDPEKVVDEFNDFLFEHTSKISLTDILEAEKKSDDKKISSPYTKFESKKEFIKWKQIKTILLIIIIMVILVILVSKIIIPDKKVIDRELKSLVETRWN